MTISFAIAIYFILWWLIFFMMLPIGVETQDEADSTILGTESSAPVSPRIGIKALWTTLASAAVFGLLYALSAFGLVDYNNLIFGRT